MNWTSELEKIIDMCRRSSVKNLPANAAFFTVDNPTKARVILLCLLETFLVFKRSNRDLKFEAQRRCHVRRYGVIEVTQILLPDIDSTDTVAVILKTTFTGVLSLCVRRFLFKASVIVQHGKMEADAIRKYRNKRTGYIIEHEGSISLKFSTDTCIEISEV